MLRSDYLYKIPIIDDDIIVMGERECHGCLSVSHCDGSAVTLILSNSGQDTTGLETRPSTTSWSKQGKQRGAAELDVGWWSSCWIVHTQITK